MGRWLAASALVCNAACGNANETEHAPLASAIQHLAPRSRPVSAQIAWPSTQLLPSFPAPAPVQDLIILGGRSEQWQAIGPSLSHATGRLETDGWLCQVGIDAPNQHMIYGPYDTTIPAGANTAQFRMAIDNNTADNNPVVTIDVNDSTSGTILASQTLTRQQFTVAATYTSFSLPFTVPADNHALEFRVYWLGAAYTKVNWVGVTRSQADDEMVLFASLKGVVNSKQPRIFSYEGDAYAEGKYTWLQSLGLTWNSISTNWDLIDKYVGEIDGIVVYDNSQPDTINLATTIAGAKHALVVAPSYVARLTAAPYNLPILADFRGQFANKLAVYQKLYDDSWPTLTHRVAFGLNPLAVRASVREYAAAVGGASLWLDPSVPSESTLLDQFLSSMGAGAVWMGWWTDEGAGVSAASNYGVATVASDYSTNLTMHSGMPRTINVQPMPIKPALQNKIYVAFILSDGDNLQYVEHLLRKLWNDPGRGKVPMGWTLSPAMVDAMPGALNYYWTSATPNDALVSGPSGYGYTYPNLWTNPAQLNQFVATTEKYNEQAGFRVTTVWNTITGGINANVGDSYAANAPSLLGVTAQNTGGGLTVYDKSLPGMALSCNYCTGEPAMEQFIGTSSQGWDGKEPRFEIIQAQPWQGVTPTSFLNVANTLTSDYVVVRPDIIFQLIREANGLTVNPVVTYSIAASSDANGSIGPNGTVSLTQNQSQTFTFTPHSGYSVGEVSIDGVAATAAPSYTFVNVTANHTISVTFTDGSEPDAGPSDAGATSLDAALADASANEPDAGGPGADAGDAGSARSDDDAGPVPVGGSSGGGSVSEPGVGCQMEGGPAPAPAAWPLLGLLLVVGRQRRRRA